MKRQGESGSRPSGAVGILWVMNSMVTLPSNAFKVWAMCAADSSSRRYCFVKYQHLGPLSRPARPQAAAAALRRARLHARRLVDWWPFGMFSMVERIPSVALGAVYSFTVSGMLANCLRT
jgi:hypothetical protein